MNEGTPFLLPKSRLEMLIGRLWEQGMRVLGPARRDGTIVFDEVRTTADLALGLRDEQAPGRYRLVSGEPEEVFGVVNGAGALKEWLFVPEETLLEIRRREKRLRVVESAPAVSLAFLGVRSCDLAAVAMQDRIFLYDRFRDTHYAARRRNALFIAVNCTRSAATCFCASMGTGPAAKDGFDLAMTELAECFVVRSGSPRGEAILADLSPSAADTSAVEEERRRIEACGAGMAGRLDTTGMSDLLFEEAESPSWEDVARRCLACTNCTMVCPTCFCHAVVDVADISGETSRRVRRWDSCFSYQHAQIHGKNFRPHIRDRYRQWLTHKLGFWIDQFGTSGCVGCGRCIAWCPVGIDLTAEIEALRRMRAVRVER